MPPPFDYSKWTSAELERAEITADHFLAKKHREIARSFEGQADLLNYLVAALKQRDLTLDQRLDFFARIADVSREIQHCANDFFELGSQPLVARVLSQA